MDRKRKRNKEEEAIKHREDATRALEILEEVLLDLVILCIIKVITCCFMIWNRA